MEKLKEMEKRRKEMEKLREEMKDFIGIDNLELMTIALLEKGRKRVNDASPAYEVLPAEAGADMLGWKGNVQIQDINHGYWRVGAVGDGNCLLHSFMTAASPTYRAQNMTTRQYIVDNFRKVLMVRMDDIRGQMDMLYFEVGGAAALEDSLEIIIVRRDEIGLEVAPAIAHLYGFNFLAIGINDALEWRPFCQTMTGFDAEMPTILIHYMGAGANFAEHEHGFSEAGHYEVIVRPVFAAAAAAAAAPAAGGAGRASRSMSKASTPAVVVFDEARTSFILTTGELCYILTLFKDRCKSDPKYVHPLESEGGPRRTASGRILSGSSGRSSSGRKSVKRTASGRTVSSGRASSNRSRHTHKKSSSGKRSNGGGGGGGGGGGPATPFWG